MTNPTYSLLLFVSGVISLIVAGVAWRRHPLAGASYLAVVMLSMALWSWMYAVSWLIPDERGKFFWIGLAFIGVVVSSPAFLAMAFEFTGHQDWINWKFHLGFFTIPVVAMLFYWTDPWFGLFFNGASISKGDDLLRGGLGFSLVGLNGYICTFWAIGLFLNYLRRVSRPKRSSIVIIFVGTSFPFFATFAGLFHLTPFRGLDLTPIVFSISGIFYAFGLFSHRMMDLAPIGRDAVLETMEEGMLVVDDINRVVDINPRARSFLNAGIDNPLGKSVMQVFSAWAGKAQFDFTAQSGNFHAQVEGPDSYHYDISVMPLVDSKGGAAGRLFVWHDVSAQKKSEIMVREANLHLKQQIDEIELLHIQLREQAIRDSLTGLFNRRYMEETLDREFARAVREETSLSVVMIDIDKFKIVNDTYSHHAGDEVLRRLGGLLMENVRAGDVPCRYGGDEILVVMPDAPYEDAMRRAQELGRIFSEEVFNFNDSAFQTTLSMGVASFPAQAKTVAELLQLSDKALYADKNEHNILH